jgi:hypothetical protein
VPGAHKVGRWLFKSSLLGLFTGYNASFEHVDGLGNARLPLIDRLEIHEMIHIVQADHSRGDGLPDFLANGVPDLRDFPDTLRFRHGSNAPVATVTNGASRGTGPSTNQITLVAADNGVPPLGGTKTFSVVARDTTADFMLAVGSTNVFGGETHSVPLRLRTDLALTELAFDLNLSPTELINLALLDVGTEVIGNTRTPIDAPNLSVRLRLDGLVPITIDWTLGRPGVPRLQQRTVQRDGDRFRPGRGGECRIAASSRNRDPR